MKKEVLEIFIGDDHLGTPVYLTLEIYMANVEGKLNTSLEAITEPYKVLTMFGHNRGISEQISEDIRATLSRYRNLIIPQDEVIEILDIWDVWHLNDMKCGTCQQNAIVGKLYYSQAIEKLKEHNMVIDKGYKYGSRWLLQELPLEVEKRIIELFKKNQK